MNIQKSKPSFLLLLFLLPGIMISCRNRTQTLTLAGSRSVGPIVEVLAERFMEESPGSQIAIQGGGSSAGVIAANEGTADIGMVSRTLAEDEPPLHETIIAYDGVAIVVHPNNPVTNMSLEQLQLVFAGEIRDWADMSGTSGAITVIDKEEGSGTRDVFLDEVMDEIPITSGAIVMDGTGAARAAVGGDLNAIGYISFAAVTDEVKVITIDSISPTPTEVLAGRYPIYREFVLVTKGNPEGLALDFINFILSESGQAIIAENDLISVHGEFQ